MAKAENLVGQVFGRLTVVERAENKGGSVYWLCRCECGNLTTVSARNLKHGDVQSCKCLFRELAAKRQTIHGKTGTSIYYIWQDVKDRCYNPNSKFFHRYGARGIKMFEGWINDFPAFFEYVSKLEHYGEKGRTLDRLDNDKGYVPGNLRWATPKEQCRNTCRNVFVDYCGAKMTLADAAERSGVPYKTLHYRYKKGERGERLFRPVERRKNGKSNFDTAGKPPRG